MSKIIQVINTMISNKEKINNVIEGNGEYFFKFNDKYIWSIFYNQEANNASLCLYPDIEVSIDDLISVKNYADYTNYIIYRSEDFKGSEALESFKELYDIVKSKLLGADDILDEILSLE